ncbi:coiled-coil domain-containing protein 152-like isoform X1 [Megalops cyprinoides]|uniref:coiled-coil domain-containing protein 152-like isoform X1 n=1 Tax=Megalops cyprinoides TaxID=118141 RepID=UPI0018648F9F|nr:coiled-coil domain-containing protein 152-like isoform X1 [Megalops cyprinoides]
MALFDVSAYSAVKRRYFPAVRYMELKAGTDLPTRYSQFIRCGKIVLNFKHPAEMGTAVKKATAVNLDTLMEDFSQLEQKVAELRGGRSALEARLQELGRLRRLSQTREQCLKEAENEKLKNSIHDMERQHTAKLRESVVVMEELKAEMAAQRVEHEQERHQIRRELQAKRELWSQLHPLKQRTT